MQDREQDGEGPEYGRVDAMRASIDDAGMALAITDPETRFMPVGDGRIAYDDTGGSGPVVLAIPGMGDLRSEYRFQRAALHGADYRFVTMDVRGFGQTSARWNDYSAHAVGRDALALMDHLDVDRAVILGTSFAAGAALWAAQDRPDRVSGLVLLGPIVHDLEMSEAQVRAVQFGFDGPDPVTFWTSYWDSLFPSRKPDDHGETTAALGLNLSEPGRIDALKTMIFLSKSDTAAIVSACRTPALVVMGSRDPDFGDPSAAAGWLGDTIGADTLIVTGAGHYPHAEMPEIVNPKLISFLQGLDGFVQASN
jgi:pimeloyl-ACP methyl ester carboxylesterase